LNTYQFFLQTHIDGEAYDLQQRQEITRKELSDLGEEIKKVKRQKDAFLGRVPK